MEALSRLGLRLPDETRVPIADGRGVADALYRASRALVFLDPPAPEILAYANDRAFQAIVFPADESAWAAIFAAHHGVFGPIATA
jgi:hypothetical protein